MFRVISTRHPTNLNLILIISIIFPSLPTLRIFHTLQLGLIFDIFHFSDLSFGSSLFHSVSLLSPPDIPGVDILFFYPRVLTSYPNNRSSPLPLSLFTYHLPSSCFYDPVPQSSSVCVVRPNSSFHKTHSNILSAPSTMSRFQLLLYISRLSQILFFLPYKCFITMPFFSPFSVSWNCGPI